MLTLGIGDGILLVFAASLILWIILPVYAFLFILIGGLISLFRYVKWSYNEVGERLGFPSPPQTFLVGHIGELNKKGFAAAIQDWVKEYGNFVWLNVFGEQVLLVADADVLKQILVKDFNVFPNHRGAVYIDNDIHTIMANMLTMIKDQRWKNVRNAVTPAFTAGKMKLMVPLVNECTQTLVEILKEKQKTGESFDVKTLCGNFTMDVVAAAAFGQKVNAMKGENSEFLQHGRKVFDFIQFKDGYCMLLLLFPAFCYYTQKFFGARWIFPASEDYFQNLLKNIFQQRKQNPASRPDFLQLLINAQETGEKAEADDMIGHGDIGARDVQLTEPEMISQAFLFLGAGFETTATTLQFVLYTLATHPDIQKKCRDEVRMLARGEALTYDMAHRMTYLESVVLETLRFYPPIPVTDRISVEDYKIDGKIVPKGTAVHIPLWYINHSPAHYPEPETFDPNRFTPEERKHRNPVTFLSFGFGPRNCIGMRFALMEIKLAVAAILSELEIVAYDETPSFPLEISKTDIFTAPVKKIFLKVTEIQD